MQKNVLILEDDIVLRKSLKNILELDDCIVFEAAHLSEAILKCKNEKIDLIFLDYNISADEIGWNLAKEIASDRKTYNRPKIVAMSATIEFKSEEVQEFKKAGIIDLFVEKPFVYREIKEQLEV